MNSSLSVLISFLQQLSAFYLPLQYFLLSGVLLRFYFNYGNRTRNQKVFACGKSTSHCNVKATFCGYFVVLGKKGFFSVRKKIQVF